MQDMGNKFSTMLFGLMIFSVGCGSVPRKTVGDSASRLQITAENHSKSISREQLLASPQLRTLVVKQDPAYEGRSMTYQAVPLSEIFKDVSVSSDSTLLFSCLDGFSAPIDAAKVLNTDNKGSKAYLAVESAASPWPPLKSGQTASAGPFYLIWENPERSQVSREEWPFQLSGFVVKPPLEVQFPLIQPDPHLPPKSVIRRGYKVFTQNCFTCHTMNGQGTSQMGPDLNIPFNPTEYFRTGFLETQIRNSQNLKKWPQGKMPPFDKTVLSDADLKAVIEYLRHMSKRKDRS